MRKKLFVPLQDLDLGLTLVKLKMREFIDHRDYQRMAYLVVLVKCHECWKSVDLRQAIYGERLFYCRDCHVLIFGIEDQSEDKDKEKGQGKGQGQEQGQGQEKGEDP